MSEKICAFFGHRQIQDEEQVKVQLLETIYSVICQDGITEFYVGNNGAFDRLAAAAVTNAKQQYPNIKLVLVFAYLPIKYTAIDKQFDASIYPEGLETVPPRFAISRRNRWMVAQSSVVIVYVQHHRGGAYTALCNATRQGIKTVNLALHSCSE